MRTGSITLWVSLAILLLVGAWWFFGRQDRHPDRIELQAPEAQFAGLPTFLLLVPGGAVELGLDSEPVVDAACQVVAPGHADAAAQISQTKLTEAMRRSASLLGRRKVEVAPMLLAKVPVTNAQYETFVLAQRKAGHQARAPFHWWRFGRIDDYAKRLEDINKAFPNVKDGALLYWGRFGPDLPYKLQDAKGRSIADLPVTFVTWHEANDFAGSWGMRLPTEAEWTRAARGDGKHAWPLAIPGDPASDKFSDKMLRDLRIFDSRDQVAKPVGTVQAAKGPFGHLDMFGQVWQFVGDLGYRPINGPDVFASEWTNLQKDEVGKLLQSPPGWKDDKAIAKGGSFLSACEPIQLLIDARAPVLTIDVMESLGIRLAKSLKPGYDALYSGLRGAFGRAQSGFAQEIDLTTQVGAERYELDAAGSPTAYAAVSFAPITSLAKEQDAELAKLVEKSQTMPMLLGVLLTTDNLLAPQVPAGIYSVLFRKAGLPRELVEAVKQGHEELAAAAKSKPSEAKPAGDEKNDKKSAWREVVARFGLTDKDLEDKDAADGNIKFVRIDGIEVPTGDDHLLLHDNDGKVVVAWKASNAKPGAVDSFPNTLHFEASDKNKIVAKLHFGVPVSVANSKRVAEFQVHVTLDRDLPGADKPWRMPVPAK